MIKQAAQSEINSRNECNIYNENNYLPIITAPMSSVVNENNYHIFVDNKIQVCLPRSIETWFWEDNVFISMSLSDFENEFLERTKSFIGKRYVCIDTANGNMKQLHKAIILAKELHGDNLIVMSGNVASVEAFLKLATTGIDYIRVGIGGGLGCNTASNIGVGQEDLEKLIFDCFYYRNRLSAGEQTIIWTAKYQQYFSELEATVVSKVKIVADGISTYIKQCETKYGFNNNGYAAINKLLWSGADLVMIGSLFAQCLESAGKKFYKQVNYYNSDVKLGELSKEESILLRFKENNLYVKYSGMSSTLEQSTYNNTIKPSEGSINYLPIRWTLAEWISGNNKQDEYPYLMGYENALKSAMSYCNAITLDKFKQNVL